MKTIPIEGEIQKAIITEIGQNILFKDMLPEEISAVISKATLIQYDNGEIIMEQGKPSNSFFLIVSGEAIIKAKSAGKGEDIELARVHPFDTIGEIGLLLKQPRSATACKYYSLHFSSIR